MLIKRGHATVQEALSHGKTESNATQKTSLIKNTLWQAGEDPIDLYVARLPAEFHGSGCSLASYIAGRLACGVSLSIAYTEAELWLQSTLRAAYQSHVQRGADNNRQLVPDRASKF